MSGPAAALLDTYASTCNSNYTGTAYVVSCARVKQISNTVTVMVVVSVTEVTEQLEVVTV